MNNHYLIQQMMGMLMLFSQLVIYLLFMLIFGQM